ncbi:RDD family protein [Caldimonas brevitalea]|uniref:RDD domain-containing protein n=1 Tax=Caldimonas brevitalea TaxID=413882 RepID=A0A0G3BMC6_9BURK|nr:RDD family protein [Caldimonas brevitalea]AKJ29133.1 hypothetical protein AAW51_2442 [Caldimonas brevitalea]
MQQLKEHDCRQDPEAPPETASEEMTDGPSGVWQTILSGHGTAAMPAAANAGWGASARAETGRPLAPLPRRGLAYAIDVAGGLSLAALVLLPLRAVSESLHEPVFVVVWLTYFLLRDSIPGQGLGKRLMGLRCVQVDSRRSCTWPQSVTRNVTHVFFVLDAIFALGRAQRRLGDYIAGTVVAPIRR